MIMPKCHARSLDDFSSQVPDVHSHSNRLAGIVVLGLQGKLPIAIRLSVGKQRAKSNEKTKARGFEAIERGKHGVGCVHGALGWIVRLHISSIPSVACGCSGVGSIFPLVARLGV